MILFPGADCSCTCACSPAIRIDREHLCRLFAADAALELEALFNDAFGLQGPAPLPARPAERIRVYPLLTCPPDNLTFFFLFVWTI